MNRYCVVKLNGAYSIKGVSYLNLAEKTLEGFTFISRNINTCVKRHLGPTHLNSLPLFTFSTKLLGQDSPSVHLFFKTIGSRFTTAKIKLGEDSPS